MAGLTFNIFGRDVNASDTVNKFEHNANQSAGRISNSFKAAGKVIAGASVAAGGALVAIGTFGVKSAAQLEQTTTSFTSLLGSASAANDMIHQLQNFAASTPFEFQDVAGYAQQFLAMHDSIGLTQKQLIPFMTTLGNLGSATGASTANIHNAILAIGQMGSVGKVQAGNLNQISQAFPGFNAAAAIANATGQTTAQVMKEMAAGTLDAATAVPALLKGMAQFKGAAGAMAAQSQTLNGLLSTFKDTVKIKLTQSLQASIPTIKKTLNQVTPAIAGGLGSLAPALAKLVSSIAPLIAPLITALSTVLTTFASTIAPVFKTLAPVFAPLANAISDVIHAFGPFLQLLANMAATILPPLLTILSDVASLFEGFGSALVDALAPVLPVIATALSAVGRALEQVMPALAPVIEALAKGLATVLMALAPQLPQIANAFAQLALAAVKIFVAVSPLIPPLTSILNLLVKIGAGVIVAIVKTLTWLANVLATILKPAVAAVIIAFNGMKQAIQWVGDKVMWFWHNAVEPAAHGIGVAFHAIVVAFNAVKDGLATAWHWIDIHIIGAFKSAWHGVVTAFHVVRDAIVAAFKFIGDHLMSIWNNSIGKVIHWISDGVDAITSSVNALLNLGKTATGKIGKDFGNFHGTATVTGSGPIGHRAFGGPVLAGMPYIVGERRPELFVPSSNGTIRPSVPGGGGGLTVNVNFTGQPLLDKTAIGRTVIESVEYAMNAGAKAHIARGIV